ncbi:Disks large-like protein 1 [Nibea albiflora]|uniref:Disks large-like protein 1 n=1 Tax=Nibea albiflora TaxID=240163 RepID=A0ACB7ESX2_NIBAL|nr:Disks large-like protein 1 [Nibea albiflora]
MNFYLSSLEEQIRSETGDSTATITQTTEGRVSINIREDVLEDFLNGLQTSKENTKNKWSQERKHRRREVHSLKAELKDAQAKYNLLSVETDDLRSNIEKLCATLRETLKQQTCKSKKNLDQTREENKALRNRIEKLDKVREKNEILQSQLEAIKLELRVEKHLRATAEYNTQLTAHSLSIQLFDEDTAEFEARSKVEQLEADLAFERTQTQKVQEKLNKVQQAFAKHREEAKKSAAQAQAAYRTQQEELRKIALSLKKAESPRNQADTERAVGLLRQYQANLTSPEEQTLRTSVGKVSAILGSQLFQALLDIQECYEVTLQLNKEHTVAKEDSRQDAWEDQEEEEGVFRVRVTSRSSAHKVERVSGLVSRSHVDVPKHHASVMPPLVIAFLPTHTGRLSFVSPHYGVCRGPTAPSSYLINCLHLPVGFQLIS